MSSVNANTIPLQQFYGYQMAWGLGTASITISGVGLLPQSADTEMGVDTWEGRDQRGTVVAYASYNPHDSETFEWIAITSASFDGGNAVVTYPTQGAMFTIGADATDPLSGSNWIAQTCLVRRANTDAAKVQLKAIRYAGVTQ